jgi:putative glutathione S-transferase
VRVFMRTERLVLRYFTMSDVDNLVALDGDPRVMRFLTGGKPTPRDVVEKDVLPRILRDYTLGPFGRWAAERRSSGEFIGWFALDPHSRTEVELGYRLTASAWGHGYATEGCRALVRHAFALGAHRVFAQTMAVNLASRRVMEKSGLIHVRTLHLDFPDPIEGTEHGEVEYELLRPLPGPADPSRNVDDRGMGETNNGEFSRDMNYITSRITADGRDGYPVEPGRYRLVVSRACPWANRAIIVRRLLGLEPVLSMGIAGPTHDERSWTFDLDPGGRDPVLGIERLQEAYFARFPGYERGITVPAIVDIPTGQVVTNDFDQITLDLSIEWRAQHRPGAPALYPEELRSEIDKVNRVVFADVNNGVYRAGFAGGQDAYEKAYRRLFDRLDWLSDRLSGQRYLVGDTITEADVRLFTTLVRFDAVYHGHFKTNRNKLTEMPVLWAYARDLYQTPGFGDTIDFDHIKRHYYEVHRQLNPSGIVPAGPDLGGWRTPHDREALGGRPFGDGTPPGPPVPEEVVANDLVGSA